MDKHASVEHKEAVIRDEGTIGNVKFFDENDLVRRISIPSADPNDPLNFSKWRKLGINFTCCWYSVFSLLVVGGSGPIFPIWIQVYAPQYSVADITDLGSYPSLAMGVGTSSFTCRQQTIRIKKATDGIRCICNSASFHGIWSSAYHARLLCPVAWIGNWGRRGSKL